MPFMFFSCKSSLCHFLNMFLNKVGPSLSAWNMQACIEHKGMHKKTICLRLQEIFPMIINSTQITLNISFKVTYKNSPSFFELIVVLKYIKEKKLSGGSSLS